MKCPLRAAALAGAVCLLSACVTTTTAPYPPVPAPQAETIPPPPVSATPLIWQPGHWNWNGSGYVWEPGMYVPQGTHSNMFMPGYWQKTPSGWAWQPAHWM
jgi:hypothetical protein